MAVLTSRKLKAAGLRAPHAEEQFDGFVQGFNDWELFW
jgi:hypothetical protein